MKLSRIACVGIGIAIGASFALVRDPRAWLDLLPFYAALALFATGVAMVAERVLPKLTGRRHAVACMTLGILVAFGIKGAIVFAQTPPRFSDWSVSRRLFVGPVEDTSDANKMIEMLVKDSDEPVEIHAEGGGTTGYAGYGARNDLGVDGSNVTRAGAALIIRSSAAGTTQFGMLENNLAELSAAGADVSGMLIFAQRGPIQMGTTSASGVSTDPRFYLEDETRTITDNVLTNVVRIDVASNAITGGLWNVTTWAVNATDQQSRTGVVPFTIINDAGTETCVIGNTAGTDNFSIIAVSTGTLTTTYSCDCTSLTNGCYLRVQADTSLTPTAMGANYSIIKNAGNGAIVPQ